MFRFIESKKAELYLLGIHLHLPVNGTMDSRFARVINQLQRLKPELQTLFNSLREKYVEDQRQLAYEQKAG